MVRACAALMCACYEFADAQLNKQVVLKAIEECLEEMLRIFQDMKKD